MYSMPSRSAVSTRSSKTFGDEGRAAADHRAGAERVAADLLLLDAGGVGGVGDVDDDRDRRLQQVGGGAGAVDADLLLDRGDAGDAGRVAAALVAATRDLERDVGAEAVVHRARGEPVAGERQRLGVDHHRVADPQHRQRLVAVGGADVDVQALELDRLLALLVLEQVDRACGRSTPGTAPSLGLRPSTRWPTRICAIPAADRREVGEALLVDVGDREPDLVDVADDRDQRLLVLAGDAGDRGADLVGLELGEGGGLAPDGRRAGPRSRRATAR